MIVRVEGVELTLRRLSFLLKATLRRFLSYHSEREIAESIQNACHDASWIR
jgi:hypothetical protein